MTPVVSSRGERRLGAEHRPTESVGLVMAVGPLRYCLAAETASSVDVCEGICAKRGKREEVTQP